MVDSHLVVESETILVPVKPAMRHLAKIKQSGKVLWRQGLLKFLELSILSLIEPIRSARLRDAVASDANKASIKIKGKSIRRGLFIDCGSNIGQGYRFFSKHYTPDIYDYILVEPNPNCLPHLQALRSDGGNIEIMKKAASTRNGHTKLFGPPSAQHEPTYEGCSIMADHNTALYDAEEFAADPVETFSLSELIEAKRSDYDVVALKMDVEGAEYEILEDMIAKGVHRKLDAAYVEFHSHYLTGSERAKKRSAEQRIQDAFSAQNIVFRRWI